jgi:hypothetical protein
MATLTYDPTPADQPEFNEAEQEALAIGEQAEADQQQMLAGKFKDAEALEQAYIELQKKMGAAEETPEPEEPAEPTEEPEKEVPETQTILSNASNEFSEKGELSAETLTQLEGMDSKDLVAAYLELQQQPQNVDLDQGTVERIYQQAGGQEGYAQLTQWAAETLPEAAVEAYNTVVNAGDPNVIQLAMAGLKAAYDEANGVDGQMITGKPAQTKEDVFRSQSEVVAAMSDARYDRDPAYRMDVFSKLERSNIDY